MLFPSFTPPIFAALFLLAPAVRGAILIDSFTDVANLSGVATVTVSQAAPDPNPRIITESGLSNVIGGSRTLSVRRETTFGTTGARSVTASITEVDAFMEFVSTPNADGRTRLTYGGAGNQLNADFSKETNILIEVLSYDFPSSLPLVFTFTLESGIGGTLATANVVRNFSGTEGIVDFAISDFVGVDLSDIDRISVLMDAPRAADFQIAFIQSVPEPSSAMIAGGAGALALLRRRRR